MRNWSLLLFAALAAPALADDLMDDCEVNDGRGDMRCVNRNGVCVEVSIDGHRTTPISRADRQRLATLPDMEDVCWQVVAPVSAQFRVQARGGGEVPAFIGALESIGAILVPLADYDPEFDGNRIEPLHSVDLEADGYRDGTWQLRKREFLATPGSGELGAGEYVVILRLHGSDNWDKQEVLVRIDPALAPSPQNAGTPPADAPAQRG
jgi:hypothetical protein